MFFLKNVIFSGDVCLDIGANFGEYTYLLSSLVGSYGKVYAFEPIRAAHAHLAHMVGYFGLENVELLDYALGAVNGYRYMEIPMCPKYSEPILGLAHFSTDSIPNSTDSRIEKVLVKTLDNFLSESKPPKIDFIKCDVEGVELDVFTNGLGLLFRFAPTILCEIENRHLNRYKRSTDQVFGFFREFDYNPFYLHKGRLHGLNSKMKSNPEELIENKYLYNFIFIHKDRLEKYCVWLA